MHVRCRLMGTAVPVVLTSVRRSLQHRCGVEVAAAVHHRFGGHDTHACPMRMMESLCAAFADELQLLYDKRDVTTVTSPRDESHIGSYLGFRAHDLQAEEISVTGLFRWGAPTLLSPDQGGELDAKLAGFGWYQGEKEAIGPRAWVGGFRGLLIDRSGLPGIIAKARKVAGDTRGAGSLLRYVGWRLTDALRLLPLLA